MNYLFRSERLNVLRKPLILLFILLFPLISGGQEQDIIPPSPNASALIEYANIPVSLDTGIPNIDLPLFSLSSNGITLPLSVSYHASGIKVNEVASWAGLGWTLNAGGAITRIVKGLPDEHENGFVGINNRGSLLKSTFKAQNVAKWGANFYDSEPDIYYFNVNGITGRFTLDDLGNVIMLPHQDVKILPAIGPQKRANYWEIIDTSGNRYKFGVLTEHTEQTKTTTQTINVPDTEKINDPFVSTWYLSEIISATGGKISFDYHSGNPIISESEVEQFDQTSCTFSGNYDGYVTFYSRNEVLAPKYLSRINSAIGHIELESSANREDLVNGEKVTNIRLFDKDSKLLKTFLLNYDYFRSSVNCSLPKCKRLKLTSIDELSSSFQKLTPYEFSYNENTNLPPVNSVEMDHWGYYNATGEANLLSRDANQVFTVDAIRTPNEVAAKANILESITYTTGGTVSFSYELNDYFSQSTGINKTIGGLRVNQITQDFGNNQTIVTNYTYKKSGSAESSGSILNTPEYNLNYAMRLTNTNTTLGYEDCTAQMVRSHSLNELFDLNGSPVYYGETQTIFSDGSSEENTFTDFSTNPDVRKTTDYYRSTFTTLNNDPIPVTGYLNILGSPFSPPSKTRFFERGKLLKKQIKNEMGNVLYELVNIYTKAVPQTNHIVRGAKVYKYASDNFTATAYFNLGVYEYTSELYSLQQSKETFFDMEDSSLKMEKQTDYVYATDYPTLLKEKSFINSKSQNISSRYFYPFDLLGVEANMQELMNHHMIGSAIMTENYVDSDLVSLSKNTYVDSNGNYTNEGGVPLLQKRLQSKDGVNFYTSATFDRYTNKGNLQEYRISGIKPVTIIWGYHNNYPLAKIEGATYNEIDNWLNNDFGNSITYLVSLTNLTLTETIKNNIKSWLNNLGTAVSQNSNGRATFNTYTFEPIVGMTSTADTRQNKTFFNYDSFNRLWQIRDRNQFILEEYKYRYRRFMADGSDTTPIFITNIDYGLSTNDYQDFIALPSQGTGRYAFKWYLGVGDSYTDFSNVVSGTDAEFRLMISCGTTRYVKLVVEDLITGQTASSIKANNNILCSQTGN
ncbi:hypothetical protein ACJD0Z_04265 [Flavobacteriaceae bacterium M23B6Z8]